MKRKYNKRKPSLRTQLLIQAEQEAELAAILNNKSNDYNIEGINLPKLKLLYICQYLNATELERLIRKAEDGLSLMLSDKNRPTPPTVIREQVRILSNKWDEHWPDPEKDVEQQLKDDEKAARELVGEANPRFNVICTPKES